MSGADTSHSDYVGGLFRSHYDWLCSRLHRHLDSRAHAEDIAADTFVQLLSSPGVVPIRQPRALLTTIAQRLMYQLWRRRDLERAYLDALDNDEACTAPSPEDLAHMLEALQAIDQLLDGLPAKVKATFLLSQLNGLTYPEIAAELGISQRSVSDYMARALNRCLPLAAGHEVHFDRAGFGPVRVSSAGATAWIDGLLQVRDRPLAEVIDALRPYHRGVLRLDPSVAGLRVSGLYRLDNPQQILDTLARTLPIHITRRTGLWVTVNAA